MRFYTPLFLSFICLVKKRKTRLPSSYHCYFSSFSLILLLYSLCLYRHIFSPSLPPSVLGRLNTLHFIHRIIAFLFPFLHLPFLFSFLIRCIHFFPLPFFRLSCLLSHNTIHRIVVFLFPFLHLPFLFSLLCFCIHIFFSSSVSCDFYKRVKQQSVTAS